MLENTNVIARFWSKVNKTDSCWLWIANTCRDGYGNITANKIQYKAHRYSLMIHGAAVPKGSIVMHTCDNPSCVRPEHLIVATQRDNIKDKVNKNRQAKGESNALSKLTESTVLEIRSLYPTLSIRKLSRKYNTCENNVRAIIKRETWKHI
jgi:hypothetical protein